MAKRKKLTRAQLTAMLRRLDQAAPAKKNAAKHKKTSWERAQAKARKRLGLPGSWRKTVKRTKKSRKAAGLADWDFPSRQKQVWKSKQRNAGKKRKPAAKKKPAALRAVKGSTGWMKATAVRFVKRGGKTVVLVRKPARKRGR